MGQEKLGFLQAKDGRILDERGQPIRLRGFNIGGWLNMENFITGFPGTESGFRAAIRNELGEEKTDVFFRNMLDNFITEADIRNLASLGATTVRVPFNYRHFEQDEQPLRIKEEGFAYLDRIIKWCSACGLYVILDLHAAQGWQNPDWHSDNPRRAVLLWSDETYAKRVENLWIEIARHYRDEGAVAGFDILNEPVCSSAQALNAMFRRLVRAVRKVDAKHLIFLEGNLFSTSFDGLEPPFDSNLVYSSHYYASPTISKGPYPGTIDGVHFDLQKLDQEFKKRRSFVSTHKVPHLIGEFGCVYRSNQFDKCRLAAVDDLITVFDGYRDHWTMWTYKDIGLMGAIHIDPDSPWMKRIKRTIAIKKKLGLDGWQPFVEGSIFMRSTVKKIVESVRWACKNSPLPYKQLELTLNNTLSVVVLAEFLLPFFASQFKSMTEEEIKGMMQSFRFDKCIHRPKLEQIIRNHCL